MTLHRVRADVASWRIIDDEAVVIHTETSDYFGLNQSGTWLWARLAERARSTDELIGLLADRYALGRESVAAGVAAFIERLAALQLVQDGLANENGSAETSAGPDEPPLDPYEPPEITRFGDLETLILSGE